MSGVSQKIFSLGQNGESGSMELFRLLKMGKVGQWNYSVCSKWRKWVKKIFSLGQNGESGSKKFSHWGMPQGRVKNEKSRVWVKPIAALGRRMREAHSRARGTKKAGHCDRLFVYGLGDII